MKEENVQIICSLCGRVIKRSENIIATNTCLCDSSNGAIHIRLHYDDFKSGCPICMSSQIALEKGSVQDYSIYSTLICTNFSCPDYKLKSDRGDRYFILYDWHPLAIIDINMISKSFEFYTRLYDTPIFNKLILKVAQNLVNNFLGLK